jgi:16S rRNA (cytosine1402-N4)-methyltransferase
MNKVVQHNPVLLQESINLLVNDKNGIYLDGTFGGGGHSKCILKKIDDNGKLIAFDKDYDAFMRASLIADERFSIYHDTFTNFEKILQLKNIKKINGALLDLGISSFQLNDNKRGISYQIESTLDMRMDLTKGSALVEWINSADFQEIYRVIKNYGEEPKAKIITNKIIFLRQKKKIITTTDLVEIIKLAIGHTNKTNKVLSRVFQSFRIFINNELEELKVFLEKVINYLDVNGVIVIISFHSLEDRIVKNFFHGITSDNISKQIPLKTSELKHIKFINLSKPVKPTFDEVKINPRARSAIMRAAKRINL